MAKSTQTENRVLRVINLNFRTLKDIFSVSNIPTKVLCPKRVRFPRK